jgi:PAS domain S-box-containing protein
MTKKNRKTKEQILTERAAAHSRIQELEEAGKKYSEAKKRIGRYTDMRQMEEELRESERRFRDMLANVKLVAVMLDGRGNIIFCNDFLLDLTGWKREDVEGKNWFDTFIPAHIREDVRGIFDEMVCSGTFPLYYENEIMTRQGEKKLIFWSNTVLCDTLGNIAGAAGIGEDITERKKAEEALRESEEKYRLLVETANEGIVVAQWGMLKFVNPTFLEITGYTREELISEPFTEIIYPDDRDFVLKRHLKILRRELGPVDTYSFRITRKDGQVRWLEARSALGAWEGSPATVNFLRDITKRRKVEESLRESEARFRNIFNSTPVSILEEDYSTVKGAIDRLKIAGVEDFRAYLDEHPGFVFEAAKMAKILDVNDATLRLYGARSKEELVGSLDRVFTSESYSAVRGFLIAIFEGKTHFESETVNKTLQGEMIDVLVSISIPSEESEFRNLLVSVMDLTEYRKLEKELLKSQRLESLGVLAGGIAHDFNNILTAILGNITLAAAYAEPEDKISERLLEAEKATLRAKDLSRQLLTFSKGGAPIKKAVSLEEIIKDASGFALRGCGVRAVLNLADGLWPVEADEGQIGQVINNIVINAVQAMPEGGVVRISAENVILWEDSGMPVDQGDYVKVTFSDRGIGIPAEFLPKIFDPYFTTKQKGSGLGLAVTYSIIKNHGGYISVESELGKGAAFFVYLPASRTRAFEKTYEKDIPISCKGRVLIMDDEDMLREVAGLMLKELGYEVDFARDGEEAIESFKKALESFRPFDAVIMDLTVPGGKGGKETIKELLKIAPEVKAIVSSGYSHDPVMSNFKEYGFSDVISKPYKSSELLNVLRRVLEGS